MRWRNVLETAANLCRTLTCIPFWSAKKKKNIYFFKLWGSCGKTITDSMFICAEATQHKERATIPRGFSWLLRRVQPIFPNPCQDLRFRCILLPPTLLYEEWSNQAWKWVSSVCWWVKRDFQNNPISSGGFFLFFMNCIFFIYFFLFFFASWAFQDSTGNSNYCRDTIFVNARTSIFFSFFCYFWRRTQITVSHVRKCDVAALLFSLLTGHILSNEMLNCFILAAESWSDTCK